MSEGQAATGTRDETYDIVAVLYHALQGAENCRTYQQDASGDEELSRFFEEAQNQQRQIADRAKQLLGARLGQSDQGGSAFGFGQSSQEGGQTNEQIRHAAELSTGVGV
jgi:hypothetical protein